MKKVILEISFCGWCVFDGTAVLSVDAYGDPARAALRNLFILEKTGIIGCVRGLENL
jgi:hypothetical protein